MNVANKTTVAMLNRLTEITSLQLSVWIQVESGRDLEMQIESGRGLERGLEGILCVFVIIIFSPAVFTTFIIVISFSSGLYPFCLCWVSLINIVVFLV